MPAPSIESVAADAWPSLPLDRWRDTYDTLHMWTQLAGKLALDLSPLTNHYWNTALQITPRGLATLPLTVDRRAVTVAFDFVAHQLTVECSDARHGPSGSCWSRSSGSWKCSAAGSSARRARSTSGGGASISPIRGSRAGGPP